VFGLWGLYSYRRLGDPNAPRNLRDPQRRIWTLSHLLGDSRWTDEGRVVRRRWLFHLAIGVLLGLAAMAIVVFVEQTRI
jgi:hypothetical protein